MLVELIRKLLFAYAFKFINFDINTLYVDKQFSVRTYSVTTPILVQHNHNVVLVTRSCSCWLHPV